MKKQLFAIILLVLLPLTFATAAKVSTLYEADMPVASQNDELKEQAIKEGFLQVLVKLSGDSHIDQNSTIKASLAKSDYYVQEFSYSTVTTSSSQYMLHIRYDKDDVNRLLVKAGAGYWGETRPLILVWMTVTNKEQHTEIVGSDMAGDMLTIMNAQSKKYGIPILFPLMDVDDVNQVSVDDVAKVALPTLRAAAKRYSPDGLLIGSIEETDDGLQSQWQLVVHDDVWNWTLADKSMDALLSSVMNEISQTLAKQYADKSTHPSELWIKLEVENITHRRDFAQLMQYLKQITLVQQVELSQVAGDVVELAVLIHGSVAGFQQNASIGQRLVLKKQDDISKKLMYEWVH